MEPSADYEDIETLPSEHTTTDSDKSKHQTPDDSTPTSEITHIPRDFNPPDVRIISGTNNSVTTYKPRKRLDLKIKVPTNQTPFCPEGNSAQHMDHNNSTENNPNYSSSEKPYTSHTNNIRIIGQYMTILLCPSILRNKHIPNRASAEQLHLQKCTLYSENGMEKCPDDNQ